MSTKQLSVVEAQRRLDRHDFGPVRRYLEVREQILPARLDGMEREYKRFLALCAAHASSKEPLPISDRVDPFWHAHILHTRDYQAMAEAVGVNTFHHEPALPDDLPALEPGYNRTLALYAEHFGTPDPDYWPAAGMICGGKGCSCSGTGNN